MPLPGATSLRGLSLAASTAPGSRLDGPLTLGPVELTAGLLLLLVVGAFAAGWIDAVVGGGGLLQLPMLLMVPGLTPVQALATNKFGSVFGTGASALTYARRIRPDPAVTVPAVVAALVASFGGAGIAAWLPEAVIRPVVLTVLAGVAAFTALRPSLGRTARPRHAARGLALRAGVIGLVIGFYDGVIGPGTGTFLVIALVTLVGLDFLQASGQAKIVNLCTNLGALAFFLPAGHVLLGLGLVLGAANLAGGWAGARTALAKGAGFVRVVFLAVVCALLLRLGWDTAVGLMPG